MAELVQESCVLRFDEHDLIEFFGVVAPLDEVAGSYTYELARDGLRLQFTLFPNDGGVGTSLYREGIVEPIALFRLAGCTHLRFITQRGTRYIEIGRPEHPTAERNAPIVWGLRIAVEPHFRQEYIHDVA